MPDTFWSNTIWYMFLGLLTIVEIILALNKAKKRLYLIALFLFASGMTFSIEVIIFCFLRAYDYYPMIILQSPIDDGLAGNLFSQFSITATALVITVYNFKWYWGIIIAGFYGGIEESFLKLGIYSHHWYQTWITVLGLIVLFGITKKMFKSSKFLTGHILRYASMFFGLYTLHMILIWWPMLLMNIVKINIRIFPDPMISYTFISFLNLLVLSIICMFTYFSSLQWWLKPIIISISYPTLYIADIYSIISVKAGWFLTVATIDIFGMLLFVYFLDKLFSKASRGVNY